MADRRELVLTITKKDKRKARKPYKAIYEQLKAYLNRDSDLIESSSI